MKIVNLIYIGLTILIIAYYFLKIRVDMDYPKYYNIDCIVIKTGELKELPKPNSYVLIQNLTDSSFTSLNSFNFPSFSKKYKVGDTLHFEFISKKRFSEN